MDETTKVGLDRPETIGSVVSAAALQIFALAGLSACRAAVSQSGIMTGGKLSCEQIRTTDTCDQ